MNTYEKLKRVEFAIQRINKVGWVQGANRRTVEDATSYAPAVTGPGCLVGSCFRDQELIAAGHYTPGEEPFDKDHSWSSSILHSAGQAYMIAFQELNMLFSAYVPPFKVPELPERQAALPRMGTAWNDTPNRTKEDVLELLEHVRADLFAQDAAEELARKSEWDAKRALDKSRLAP